MIEPIDWSLVAHFLGALGFGYLCGSIPFGILLTRLAGTADLRSIGSGNIGATNVLRTGRKGLAAATLLGDMLKGTVAVLLAALFLGHLFPIWLRFRGGKGVATYIGVLLGLAWPAAIFFCAIWLATAAVTRYSSLAALVASAATPAFLWWRGDVPEALVFLALSVLLWIRHRTNIARLLAGAEGKVGRRSAA